MLQLAIESRTKADAELSVVVRYLHFSVQVVLERAGIFVWGERGLSVFDPIGFGFLLRLFPCASSALNVLSKSALQSRGGAPR